MKLLIALAFLTCFFSRTNPLIYSNLNNQYLVPLVINPIDPSVLPTILTNTGRVWNLNYDYNQEPNTQWQGYPSCRGPNQSPIDISSPMIIDNYASLSLSPSVYVPSTAVAYNNGHFRK